LLFVLPVPFRCWLHLHRWIVVQYDIRLPGAPPRVEMCGACGKWRGDVENITGCLPRRAGAR
jgi:hypothetical protein